MKAANSNFLRFVLLLFNKLTVVVGKKILGGGEAFEIITSELVILLWKTIPSACCSIESQGRHSSKAQSRVDRPRHLSLSSL